MVLLFRFQATSDFTCIPRIPPSAYQLNNKKTHSHECEYVFVVANNSAANGTAQGDFVNIYHVIISEIDVILDQLFYAFMD